MIQSGQSLEDDNSTEGGVGIDGKPTVGEIIDNVSKSPGFLRNVLHSIRAMLHARALEAENQILKARNQRLLHENTHDDLTGLLTKKAWRAEIGERIKTGEPFGVIFMDMDAFKAVNDEIGHQKGDKLLEGFGEHLRSSFKRDGEVLSHERFFGQLGGNELSAGRLGGDEFGVIVNLSDRGRTDGLTIEQRMQKTEEHTQTVVGEFVDLQDERVQALHYNISLGGAIWDPERPITDKELIHQADQVMYQAKAAKKAAR